MADAPVVFAPFSPQLAKGKLGLNSFSTIPTIAEINASSDWHQVFALFNRRSAQIYQFPAIATLTPSGAGQWPSPGSINALRLLINGLRADVGMSAFSFGASAAAGHVIRAQHLIDLRTAISAIGPTFSIPVGNVYNYIRNDNHFGTFVSDANTGGSGGFIGTIDSTPPASGPATRYRSGVSFLIPADFIASASLSLHTTFAVSGPTLAAKIYTSNSDDHAAPSGWWNNLNNLQFSGAINGANVFGAMSASAIAGKFGQYVSFIIGSASELGNVESNDAVTDFGVSQMVIDFGF